MYALWNLRRKNEEEVLVVVVVVTVVVVDIRVKFEWIWTTGSAYSVVSYIFGTRRGQSEIVFYIEN